MHRGGARCLPPNLGWSPLRTIKSFYISTNRLVIIQRQFVYVLFTPVFFAKCGSIAQRSRQLCPRRLDMHDISVPANLEHRLDQFKDISTAVKGVPLLLRQFEIHKGLYQLFDVRLPPRNLRQCAYRLYR
jgi:hypothetical protein